MGIKRYIIFLLINCAAYASTAQSSYVDSLENLLKTPIPDTVKVWALNELSREYIYGAPEKSLSMAMESQKLAREIGYTRGEAYSYRVMATLSATHDQYLSYSENLQKAIRLFIMLQDSIGVGNCYITEAVVHNRQLKFEQAIDSYRKALAIFRNASMDDRVAVCANNMGFVYYRMGRFEDAKKILLEAVEINQSVNNASLLMGIYDNLGLVYNKLGDADTAYEYFENVIALNDELKENSNIEAYVETLIELSSIYYERNQPEKQKYYLELARETAENFKYLELLKQANYNLTVYHLHMGDIKKAYQALKSFTVADDSITQQRTRNEAAIITSIINSTKLETDFENAQDNISKQELVILQQERTLIVVAIVGVLFIILSVQLILVNRSRRAMNQAMARHRIVIDAKNNELEKLNQTKDKFFSVVAHDLRSPLNSLLGFSTLLAKHADSMSNEEIQKMGGQLQDAVGNTLKMTENLILWARSQMKDEKTKPEPVEVNTALSETFKMFKDAAAKKEIQLDHEVVGEAKVFVDKDHFLLILRNLINNAIKFTRIGGKICVKAKQQNGITQIIVEDTGLGMDEEALKKLFTMEGAISQLGTSGERGTGLGLMLCKDFAERNNGKLEVKSEKNIGSSFIVTLPSFN
jgi:signal transduction histidine kinase